MKTARRKFLKFLGTGLGAFAAGFVLGPGLFLVSKRQDIPTKTFRQFDIKEVAGELRFYDRASREPILIIEKDAIA